MADRRVPSQQAAHIPADTSSHPALHQSHGHVQRNPHVASHDQQDDHREGVPQPVGNVIYPEVPHVHMHRDVGVAEPVPAQAHPFALRIHDDPLNHGAQFPAAGPPGAFPGVWPHPAPPANMPPADGLRNLAGRYLNNPNTRVSLLRIEPGPDGRFEVWIALDLADIL
ncbi:hypothetical protein BJY52DRAFT_1274481 [Lactarius psammicola]|nr:hypothetical protein BJY52DRAFT_1274481 [Lactarius psammicola]